MQQRVLCLFIALLLGSGGMAAAQHSVGDTWEVEGINYRVTSVGLREVEVCEKDPMYEGDVKIPEEVEKDGEKYRVTRIGKGAFEPSSSLTAITLPNSVRSIGKRAFFDCAALTTVVLPNSVTSIGELAFALCKALTSITIPKSVVSIEGSLFSVCSKLQRIDVEEGNPNYESIDGLLFTKGGKELIQYPNGKTGKDYTLPSFTTSIWKGAFAFSNALTSVTLPNTLTHIGELAFLGCKSLYRINVESTNPNYESIDGVLFAKATKELMQYPSGKKEQSYTIPNSATSIGVYAFRGNTSLIIPKSVTSIGDYAFSDCRSLSSVTIPHSVKTIGKYVFSRAESLLSLCCLPENPPSIEDLKLNSGVKVYVPKASLAQYKATYFWKDMNLIPFALSLTPASKTIGVHEMLKLEATVEPGDLALRWKSSGESVATVDENGNVKGLKDGVVCISVGPKDFDAPTECYIAVGAGKFPSSISLDQKEKKLTDGESFKLAATVLPDDASDWRVSWRSSNPAVATVDASGKVRANGPGKAMIIAATAIGGIEAKCEVTVEAVPVTGVSLSMPSKTLRVGESFKLIVTVFPQNASNKKVS